MSKLPHRQVSEQQIGDTHFPALQYPTPNIIVTILVCLLALTGCVSWPSGVSPLNGSQPLVKIGLAAPFEGLDRPQGYEALVGVKLALSERNAAGGVAGYMVELVALNDFGEPDEARLQALEFAADPSVLGVVTGWTEEPACASLPVYRQAGLAVAVPWSVHPELAERESGVVLVAADVQRTAGELAEVVAATSPSKLAVVGNEPSVAFYAESMATLDMEAQVVSPPTALDGEASQEWAARLVLSRTRPPDAVILTTDGTLAGEVLLALDSQDWDGAIFGGVDAGSVQMVSVAGGLTSGLTYVSPAPAGQDVLPIDRNLAVEKEGLAPRAVLAYDATNVLLDAIESAIREDGYPSRQGVVAALPEVRRHGLTGDISFDAVGRRVDAPVWLYTIVSDGYPGQALLSPQRTTGE
jgi:branched-chain amino acid transport system substrate-binding protein